MYTGGQQNPSEESCPFSSSTGIPRIVSTLTQQFDQESRTKNKPRALNLLEVGLAEETAGHVALAEVVFDSALLGLVALDNGNRATERTS